VLTSLLITLMPYTPPVANAAVADWIQGASITPYTTTHFGTEEMKESLRRLEATGANYAILIIPYYQPNRQSTEMRPSWNTPTDESLIDAITYAKSLGLKVMLKPHLETDYIEWRGNIDPAPEDHPAWFASYTEMLLKYGRIAEQYGVEDICIGTELIRMANPNYDSTNTENWKKMIADLRGVYSGKLTYSSNWDGELEFIGFWDDLDYIGISAYYDLYHAQNSSPEELRKSWDNWRTGVVEPFYKKHGKPIMFTELGYRSINDAHRDPWDWSRWAPFNETDQANAYEALFSYWDDYPWMIGVGLWRWDVHPDAGGQGDTDYMPQNKAAEAVMTKWFSGSGTPEEPQPNPEDPAPENPDPVDSGNPNFSASASAVTATDQTGENGTYKIDVTNTGTDTTGSIVDVEIYREDGSRILQEFFENQTFAANETNSYDVSFTPDVEGNYRIAVGAFNSTWGTNYYWGNEVLTVPVGVNSRPNPEPEPDPEPEPEPEEPQPDPEPSTPSPESQSLDIWWPTDGAGVSGVQPFKARLGDADITKYRMYWQVDGGRLVEMPNDTTDAPHKESLVDLSGWTWKSDNGPYTVNFVGKDMNGSIIKEKEVNIKVY